MLPKKAVPLGRTPTDELRKKLIKKTLSPKECQRLLDAGANPNEEKAGEIPISLLAVRLGNSLVLDKIFTRLVGASQAFIEYLDGVKNFDANAIKRCDILLQNGANINALSKLEQMLVDGTVERRHLTVAGVFNQQKESIYMSSGVASLELLGQKLLYVLNHGCQMDPGDAREFLHGFCYFVSPLEDKHSALINKLLQVGAFLLTDDPDVAVVQESIAVALARTVSYENLFFLLQAARAAGQDAQASIFENAFVIRQKQREERRKLFEEEQRLFELKRAEISCRVAEAKRQMEEAEAKASVQKLQHQAEAMPAAQHATMPEKQVVSLSKLKKKIIKPKQKEVLESVKEADELQVMREQEEAARRAKEEEMARQAKLAAEAEAKRQQELEAKARQEAKAARKKLKKQVALEKRQAAKQKRKADTTITTLPPVLEAPVQHVSDASDLSGSVMPVLKQAVPEPEILPLVAAEAFHKKKLETIIQDFIVLIKQLNIDTNVLLHAEANRNLLLMLNRLPELTLSAIFDCVNDHHASGAALNCYGISKLIQKLAGELNFYEIAIVLFEAALAKGESVVNAYVSCAIFEAAIHCNRQRELPIILAKIPQGVLKDAMRYFSHVKFADEKFSPLKKLLSDRMMSLSVPSVAQAMIAVSALYNKAPATEQTEVNHVGLCL
ncbi:MAG: hypothetical protein K0S08_492 [Gammaproteobacteria bacterium]|jgi:hypothetical protein|nr:hypothetical protein [Gammaproteobacteria bacterium]